MDEQQGAVRELSSVKTVSRTADRGSVRAMLFIDAGDFANAQAVLDTEVENGKKDPYRETLRAEIALYAGRFEEAEELLKQAAAELSGIRSVARWTMARGQLHCGRHEDATARDLFQGALRNYQYIGDNFGVAQALYHLGELERRSGQYDLAATHLGEARTHLEGKGRRGDCLDGLIQFNLGVCKQHLGLLDEAQPCYEGSLGLLRQTENYRYYALALNGFGTLWQERGQYDQALQSLEEAARLVETDGTEEDAALIRWNLGQCLLRAGKSELAEVVLKQAHELNAKVGNQAGVCAILGLLTQLYLDQNAMDKAEQSARDTLEQAQAFQDPQQVLVAQIMLAHIYILRGKKDEAQILLTTAADSADQLSLPALKAQCLMYMAECCLPKRAPEAQNFLSACAVLLENVTDQKILREFQRIRTKATHSRIRLTPEGDLIISKSFLPEWGEAKEAVESFLIKHALDQSDDNNTRAAKILAISKVHLCEKRKQYKL
jgi:tetratricopeptide (TPR) repeat protein